MDITADQKDDATPEPVTPAPGSRRAAHRILVLQGGGALGSYQGGVYEALSRHGMEPEWVAGVSIGAINAALIAGNPPERRVERLRRFWETVSSASLPVPAAGGDPVRTVYSQLSAAAVALFGTPGFFRPRLSGPLLARPGSPAALSLYDTGPLRRTLEELVDFDLLNHGPVRLSVGAVNVLTGNNVVFDSTERRIGPEHIMASGALPPGLPPVMIEGEPYWDGGLVSNTPLHFVMDVEHEKDLLIFQVDLFPARGPMPCTLAEADERAKDIRFSSRTRMNTDNNMNMHRLKKALRELLDRLPEDMAGHDDITLLRKAAKENGVTIVQLIYRKRPYEGGAKDFEFSRPTMIDHWNSGIADVEHCMTAHLAEIVAVPPTGVVAVDPGRP